MKYTYSVEKGKPINYVMHSDVSKRRYYSNPRAFMITDFTIPSPMYPCREEFLKENFIDKVSYHDVEFNHVYFPFTTSRIEFSSFYHQPTILSCFTKFYIISDVDKNISLDLKITGGIKVWVNGKEVYLFKPYIRQTGTESTFSFNVKKGENEVIVFFNDIAERDISYYYELTNCNDFPLTCMIDLNSDIDKINKIYDLMQNFYLDKDYYEEGKVYLNINDDFDFSFDLNVSIDKERKVLHITNDIKKYEIYEVNENTSSGHKFVKISVRIGDIEISQNLFISFYPKARFEKYSSLVIDDFKERQKVVRNLLIESKGASVQKAMAIMEEKHIFNNDAREAIRPLIDKINRRDDCSDFHLASFVMLYTKYGYLLSKDEKEELKQMILMFRYSYDEIGNDVMCFYSENHIMGFAVAQYLAGNLFKDEVFLASNRLGKEQYEIGRVRVNKWIDAFLERGLSEWNSNTYIPVNFISLLPLFEMAPDEDVKQKAKNALDMIIEVVGKNIFKGCLESTHGRTYEKEIKCDKTIEMSFLNWLLFGRGYINDNIRGAGILSLCSYEPRNICKENDVKDDECYSLKALQGHIPTKTYLYRTKDYSIGSSICYKVGMHGSHDQLINVAISKDGLLLRTWVNHPGEKPVSGEGRPSYWVGCGVNPHIEQYNNCVLSIFNINESDDIDFVHQYFPTYYFDEFKVFNNFTFLRVNDTYVGTYFSKKCELIVDGPTANREVRAYGRNVKTIIIASSKDEVGSFYNFIDKMTGSNITCSEDSITIKLKNELRLEYNKGLFVNGKMETYDYTVDLKTKICKKGSIF